MNEEDTEKEKKMSTQIKFENLTNTRDLGGMHTKDGRTIVKGKLFRSGELASASEADIDKLKSLNLTHIVDLRTPEEVKEAPDPELPGVKECYIPLVTTVSLGITREEETDKQVIKAMMNGYSEDSKTPQEYMHVVYTGLIEEETALRGYTNFFDLLLQPSTESVLWHCTAGKDRAGVTTALLMECLGLDYDSIVEDYLSTNKYIQEDHDKMYEKIPEKYRLMMPGMDNMIREYFSADKGSLDAIYRVIDEKWGDMQNFLETRIGMTAERQRMLQEKFLV